MKNRWKAGWHLTKQTLNKFVDDRPLDYAATIGFYTIFSLPALLLILIRIAGSAFGQEAVQGQVVAQVSHIVGKKSAEGIQNIIENASQSSASSIGTLIGIATMIFAATTVFISLQDALNGIWGVKPKPEKGWVKLITDRLVSVALVVSFGFLLMVSLFAEVLLGILSDYIRKVFTGLGEVLINGGQLVLTILVSFLIFATLFRVLPDAQIRWRNVWIGAAVTALLFGLGKYLINFYLQHDPLSDTYGAAASLVLILVWVYYSSIVFLLGAEFTQVYAQEYGEGIRPSEHAVLVKVKEVESEE